MSPTRSSDDLPDPKDLSHHLSRVTRNRQASSIKSFYKYFAIPGIGQLAGGLPNDHYFPFDDLEAKVALADRWKPTDNKPVDPPAKSKAKAPSSSEPPASHLVVPKTAPTPNPLLKIDLASALQYGTAQGYPPLYQFIRQFTTQNLHPNVPYKGGPEIILTCGSTDGFAKTIQALNNEWTAGHDPVWAKEGLLVEEFAYMNAVQTARPRGMNIVPVGIDSEGMRASGKGGLQDVMDNWDFSKGARPHLMYTVTMGQNPTSGTLSIVRRKQIYAICQRYDIIIVEDDPYWYMQFPLSQSHADSITAQNLSDGRKSTGYSFLDSLVPSYLSIDVDGRVVRLDTFSKTVAPGCRLGWITAQPALIERILRITETSTQQPSGFVQSMIAELLIGPVPNSDKGKGGGKDAKGWSMDGWVRWLEGLRGEYQHRMEEMCAILEKGTTLAVSSQDIPRSPQSSLFEKMRRFHDSRQGTSATLTVPNPDDEWDTIEKIHPYTFDRPLAGMFIWITFHFETHPLAHKVAHPRLSRALWVLWTMDPYKVLVVPGLVFAPTEEIREKEAWKNFRLCFAAIAREQLEPVSTRFVEGVRKFWSLKKVGDIDEILKDDDMAALSVDDAVGGNVEDMAMLTGFC